MKRIRTVSEREVAFTVRGDSQGGKRMVRSQGTEFVRRFMLHTLPTGIKRIRHYGVLASACKGVKLCAARLALQMPAPNREAMESAKAFMVIVSTRLHAVASEPGATLRTCSNVTNQQGIAGI